MGQPIVDDRPDPAPFEGWIAFPFMTGNQQQNSLSSRRRAFQRPVDGLPRPVKIMAVQVEGSVRLDPPGTQAPVPSSV